MKRCRTTMKRQGTATKVRTVGLMHAPINLCTICCVHVKYIDPVSPVGWFAGGQDDLYAVPDEAGSSAPLNNILLPKPVNHTP